MRHFKPKPFRFTSHINLPESRNEHGLGFAFLLNIELERTGREVECGRRLIAVRLNGFPWIALHTALLFVVQHIQSHTVD